MFNALTGLSVLSWGVLGLIGAAPADRWSAGRISIAILHFVVGTLFLVRRPMRSQASWRHLAACLPSFIAGALAFKLAAPCGRWPVHAQLVFATGAAAACLSLATLGRSFAALPAFRGLVENGPYRLVRHPAYASELIMLSACALAAPTIPIAITLAAGAVLMILRIHVEEHFLSNNPDYVAYKEKVPRRLIPGIW